MQARNGLTVVKVGPQNYMLAPVAPSADEAAHDEASILLLLLPGAYMTPANFEGVVTRLRVGACMFTLTGFFISDINYNITSKWCTVTGGAGRTREALGGHRAADLAGGGCEGARCHAAGGRAGGRLFGGAPGTSAAAGLPCREAPFRQASALSQLCSSTACMLEEADA